MSDPSSVPPRWAGRAFGVGLILLLVAGGYAFWRTSEDLGEVHAVRDQVRELETAVRKHDSGVLAIVEESHGDGPVIRPMAEDDRQHRQMLILLDELSHASEFALEHCDIHVDGARAMVTCAVRGRPEPPPVLSGTATPRPLPPTLHIEYRRAAGRWGLFSIEAEPAVR